MSSRIFRRPSLIIVGCAILGTISILGAWLLDPWHGGVMGGGGTSVGDTSVQYLLTPEGITLVIWCDGTGPCGSSSESSLFSSSARGFFSSADGKRVDWQWDAGKDKNGHFQINGTPHDLARGTVLLVNANGDQLRVKQLDIDLSNVQPNQRGLEALAKSEPTITQFVANAARQK